MSKEHPFSVELFMDGFCSSQNIFCSEGKSVITSLIGGYIVQLDVFRFLYSEICLFNIKQSLGKKNEMKILNKGKSWSLVGR